jgi:hypothetical protein
LFHLFTLWRNGLDTISIIDDKWICNSGTADSLCCVSGTGKVIGCWGAVEPEIGRPLILGAGMSVAEEVTAIFLGCSSNSGCYFLPLAVWNMDWITDQKYEAQPCASYPYFDI